MLRARLAPAAAGVLSVAYLSGCGVGSEPPAAEDPAALLAAGAEILARSSDTVGAQELTRLKLRTPDGDVIGVTLDEHGREVSAGELPVVERDPIDARLREVLARPAAHAGDAHLVVVLVLRDEVEESGEAPGWAEVDLSGDGGMVLRLGGVEVDDAAVQAENERVLQALARRQEARVQRRDAAVRALSARNGWDAAEAASSLQGTRLRRTLARGALEAFMARNADLVEAVEPYVAPAPSINGGLASIGVTPWAHSYGHQGNGIGVFMSEAGGGCPTTPHVDGTRYKNLSGGSGDWHANMVGNVLYRTAPQAHIYCGSAASMISNPAAYSPRIFATNHSWNYYTDDKTYFAADRDFDNAVYNDRLAVFVSAGNKFGSGNNVLSPGKAFNVLTVGNYDDSTNLMAPSSLYGNPSPGHEKPDFVAPGTDISTSAGTGTGTSLSSPFSAGFAADLMSAYSWTQVNPATLKAMMMAGASRNIEGAARLSDQDGAGGLQYLNTGYYGSALWWWGPNNSHFDATNKVTFTRYLVAGQRYRMALSWLVPGSYAYSNNKANMDLDFWVTAPSGSTVAGSYSFANGFEIVDFVAPTTGTYTVTIHRYWNSGIGDVVMAHHTQAIQ